MKLIFKFQNIIYAQTDKIKQNTTLTQHESIKQLNIKHESLAIMNLWTQLPGNGAKFHRGRTRIK